MDQSEPLDKSSWLTMQPAADALDIVDKKRVMVKLILSFTCTKINEMNKILYSLSCR